MNTLTNKLKLSRPLAIFDIESTGLNPWSDHIIELAIIEVVQRNSNIVNSSARNDLLCDLLGLVVKSNNVVAIHFL